jgi:hypothetical protein
MFKKSDNAKGVFSIKYVLWDKSVLNMIMKTTKRGRLTSASIAKSLRELILSREFLERSREKLVDFTRNRKMCFTNLVIFMINLVRTSTQTALDRFWELIGTPDEHMTQQSFSEARKKLCAEACRELFQHTVKRVYANEVDRWHGMVVVAIDGSKIQLPDDKRLLAAFGGMGRESDVPMAQASTAYDVFNNIIVDAEIEPLSISENELAVRHIDRIASISGMGETLLIFDRGYSSTSLMARIEERGMKFLIRVRRKFNMEIDALGNGVHDFTLSHAGSEIKVKVVKFVLPSGEIETLITNIFDENLDLEAFKDLYFKRWPIETKYGELKLKLELENFSGRTERTIRQDYYITVMLSNIIAVAEREAQPIVDHAREGKGNKYRYKINVNHAIGTFKDHFIRALLEENDEKRVEKIDKIIELLCEHVVPERKGRSSPRNSSPRQSRFHHNMKSNC